MQSSSSEEDEQPEDAGAARGSARGAARGDTASPQITTRPHRGRSKLWKHFIEKNKKLKCKLCASKFGMKTASTNLSRHLSVAHDIKITKSGTHYSKLLNMRSKIQGDTLGCRLLTSKLKFWFSIQSGAAYHSQGFGDKNLGSSPGLLGQ